MESPVQQGNLVHIQPVFTIHVRISSILPYKIRKSVFPSQSEAYSGPCTHLLRLRLRLGSGAVPATHTGFTNVRDLFRSFCDMVYEISRICVSTLRIRLQAES